MVNIPYLGSAPAQQALIAGQVDLLIDEIGILFPLYKAGLVKVLAISATERIADMPGIPSLAEAGLRDLDISNWYGVLAPPRRRRRSSPSSNQAINGSLALAEVRNGIAALMLQPTGGSQREFVDFLARDRRRWGKIIQRIH